MNSLAHRGKVALKGLVDSLLHYKYYLNRLQETIEFVGHREGTNKKSPNKSLKSEKVTFLLFSIYYAVYLLISWQFKMREFHQISSLLKILL